MGTDLYFYSPLSTSLHYEATDSGLSTFIIHRMPDPRMDGQAELLWMAG